MAIPPEVLAAKDALEDFLFSTGIVTGVAIGVRDEEQPDPDDLALRVFVRDASRVPIEVRTALQFFPFQVVFVQRAFATAQLPDNDRYRPVEGGVSVSPKRFFNAGAGVQHVGTLGAIVKDPLNPDIRYGLSNHHVMCVDMSRSAGDMMLQPAPTFLGPFPIDEIGPLSDWSFPENTETGELDAAVCRIDLASIEAVVDIGPVSGVVDAEPCMQVSKRGRSTGQTFGWIEDIHGSFEADYPQMPPITNAQGAQTTRRILRNQLQIHVDFPLSIAIGEKGDSGSAVVAGDKVVGLYWGSGFDPANPGNPIQHGIASRATEIERLMGVNF
ncbi:MAG: hypothetical protein E5W38_02010 [Mesorhizobium sp.]|nr:MAG: hypothetical protein E5W38_02010 [Mesorhizobium sp.]